MSTEPIVPAPHPNRRWRRRLARVCIVAVACYLLRGPLLYAVAAFLVVSGPNEPADAVLIVDGERRFEVAAAQLRSGAATRILWIEHNAQPPTVRYGILAPAEALVRRELSALNVPAQALTVLHSDVDSDWDRARALAAWLADHPDARVAVLTTAFSTRRRRHVFAGVLGPDATRLSWYGLPKRRFDESTWWRQRDGLLNVFGSYVRLAYAYLIGEQSERYPAWDPDQYEKDLLRRVAR